MDAIASSTNAEAPKPRQRARPADLVPPKPTLYKQVGYNALHTFCRLTGVLGFGLRIFGREKTPKRGPALMCMNHQSHFDPLLAGITLDVRVSFLAKRSLFDVPVIAQIIEYLDSIPVDREGSAFAAMKEAMKRLKRGEQVGLFPEGTRSRDGEIAPLKPGFTMLAKRTGVPIIPVAMDGAYQAWPRTNWFPRFTQIIIVIGDTIPAEDVERLTDAELLAEVERRMRACHAQARRYRESCYGGG